jgi:threonine dehydratase
MDDVVAPSYLDILAAAARIAPFARVTPVLRSPALDALAGAELHFKCENLQRGGAFKFRGACNAVWALPDEDAARGVLTHSSGNHGAALALAANTRGIPAHVVVPEGAVKTKVTLIEDAGAHLHWCAPTLAAREATCARLRDELGATLVHPYHDTRVMAGQGTAMLELRREAGSLDAVLVPVGGGGLVAGTAIAAASVSPGTRIFAAEPESGADAWASLQRGERITDLVPDTIADGLRATIGPRNFAVLREQGVQVLLVGEDEIRAAMRLLWEHLKLVVEPSSATVLAALLRHRGAVAGRRIGLILTGGNVDLDARFW